MSRTRGRQHFRRGHGPLIGVIHLPPLPGSPRHDSRTAAGIVDTAVRDARALLDAGFDGYVLENFGDVPFHAGPVPPWVVAWMARIAAELPRPASGPAIVNVLRNDAAAGLAVASAADLDGIRVNVHTGAMVTDQGIVEGRAADTLRTRQVVAPDVAILADVDVKHAAPLAAGYPLADAARDTAYRGLADALIVTGRATGSGASIDDLRTVRDAVPDRPVLVGSGVTFDDARDWFEASDGLIVGTILKEEGRAGGPVDPDRARRFVAAARPGPR